MQIERKSIFSPKELAERWGVSRPAISEMEKDGRLHRLHNLPGIRYRAKEVYELEQLDKEDWGPMSPLERRRLLREVDTWKNLAIYLRDQMNKIAPVALEVSQYMQGEFQKSTGEMTRR